MQIALAASVLLAAATPPAVPDDAACHVVSPTVRIYHWTRPHGEAGKLKVMIYPAVDEWPNDAWGGEVTVTPVPLCCGAVRTCHRWKKSERIEPKWAGTVRVGSSYSLAFRFR